MSNSVKNAIQKLFDDAARSKSAISRLLNPGLDGAGNRLYPARTQNNDKKYGIRIDKGETVNGQPNTLRLNLQINSNAESKTLRDLAKKDPHRVVSTVDVDTKQEASKENLDNLKDRFKQNLKV